MQAEKSSRQLDIQLFCIHYFRDILIISIHIMNEDHRKCESYRKVETEFWCILKCKGWKIEAKSARGQKTKKCQPTGGKKNPGKYDILEAKHRKCFNK